MTNERNPMPTKPKKRKTPYWKRAIREAIKRGDRFIVSDFIKVAAWHTCACGELSKRIPRDENGTPKDRQLRKLGIRFATIVTTDKTHKAEEMRLKIKHRAAIVIAQSRKDKSK